MFNNSINSKGLSDTSIDSISINGGGSGGGGGGTGGSPIGLLLALTYAMGSSNAGSPIGLLLSLTKAS